MGLLGACASIVSSTSSPVALSTDPEAAHCLLTGRDGFRLEVDTPARLVLPAKAAPVEVSCSAPGRRTAMAVLTTSSDGWVWGNVALVVASGGAAGLLGVAIDGARSAGQVYDDHRTVELAPAKPRPVHARQRDGVRTDLDGR